MTSRLRRSARAAALLAAAAVLPPAMAQTAGDPVRGKLLFEDTPGTSGQNTITGSCTGCHQDVYNRRAKLSGGDATAAIPFDTAMEKLSNAVLNRAPMATFKVLEREELEHLAAFIADAPTVSPETLALSFTSPAVNTPAPPQAVTLHGPKAPYVGAALVLQSIEIASTGNGNFAREYSCDGKVFAAGESCTFNVRYDPRNATVSNTVLKLTMKDGPTGTPYTRSVVLKGSIGGGGGAGTPATPSSQPEDDSGGGATGLGLVAALAAASALLGTRRRRA